MSRLAVFLFLAITVAHSELTLNGVVIDDKSKDPIPLVNVYDSNGAFVKEVFKGILNSGEFSFQWDGISQNGNEMSSGLYFCKLILNNEIVASTKMILLK